MTTNKLSFSLQQLAYQAVQYHVQVFDPDIRIISSYMLNQAIRNAVLRGETHRSRLHSRLVTEAFVQRMGHTADSQDSLFQLASKTIHTCHLQKCLEKEAKAGKKRSRDAHEIQIHYKLKKTGLSKELRKRVEQVTLETNK
jgi:hypothetical protein